MKLFISTVIVLLTLIIGSAHAKQNAFSVVVRVNDDVITRFDVEQRLALAMASSGLPNAPEVRQRLAPQITRQLVDEALQMQEAERVGVTVSDKEVASAIEKVAQGNNMSRDQFATMLKRIGLDISILEDQIRPQVAWGKTIRRKYSQRLRPSDADIDDELNRLRNEAQQTSYLLAEIVLPINQDHERAVMRQTAAELIDQLRKNASFPALAQQFSQSPSAASGGDVGWVAENQLEPEVRQVLSMMQSKQLSPPIETRDAIRIVLLRDKRLAQAQRLDQTQISVVAIQWPVPEVGDMQQQATEVLRANIQNCAQAKQFAEQSQLAVSTLSTADILKLPPPHQQAISSLSDNATTPFLPVTPSPVTYTLCERVVNDVELPSRAKVAELLLSERLTRQAQQLLRDLRLDAVITNEADAPPPAQEKE